VVVPAAIFTRQTGVDMMIVAAGVNPAAQRRVVSFRLPSAPVDAVRGAVPIQISASVMVVVAAGTIWTTP
jgi:hypothetical protein